MLFSRQWSGILGAVSATVIFLFLLLQGHIPSKLSNEPSASTRVSSDSVSHTTPGAQDHHHSNLGLPKVPVLTAMTDIYPLQTNIASPNTNLLRKAVVVGKLSSTNTDWVEQELTDWESSIYVVDLPENVQSPTGLKTKINKANEVYPYLTYIIDHYHNLPDITAFIHSSRISWHNDSPYWNVANMLLWLNPSLVQKRGFINLRCTHHPGCPHEIQLNRTPTTNVESAYPIIFSNFFNISLPTIRQNFPTIASPCCAQFAVSRSQILSRPREEYERFLRIIDDSPFESHVLGTVMEYMWHIIFGQDAVLCDELEDVCRKERYGWGEPGEWPVADLPGNYGFGAVGPPSQE